LKDHLRYPECKEWCATEKYTCLSITHCHEIQKKQLEMLFGDLSQNNFPEKPEPDRNFQNENRVCNTTHHTKYSTSLRKEGRKEESVPQEITGVV